MAELTNIGLPDNWIIAKLSDMVIDPKSDFVDGPFGSNLKANEYRDEGIPVFRIQNIKAGYFLDKNIQFVTPQKAEQIKRHSFKYGDIIITKLGEPLGLCCKVPAKYPYGIIVADLMRVRPSAIIVNTNYLVYAINSKIIQDQFKRITKGTTRARVNLTIVRDIEIPLAPLNEQNRIVDKLDELLSELEKGKEQLQTSLEQLKVYRQTILKHAFEGKLSEGWRGKQKKLKTPAELVAEIKVYRKQQYEKQLKEFKAGKIKVKPKEPRDFSPVSKKLSENFNLIPSSWSWTQINEISDNIAYGYTEKSSKEKIGPKFLRITDIQDNAVNWNTVPYCKIDREKIGQYLLSKGDLVFARTGATVGKSFLIRNDPPDAVYASYLIRIRVYKIFIPEFMAYFFQSDFYWKQITEGQVGIGQPNVNGSKLSELFIPLMSREEQKEIVKLLDNSMSNCDQLERTIIENINSVDVVKQGLLQKAFEGKLVEQDSKEEPASELLDRIKKEREEFLKAEKERKKTEKPLYIKTRKMAEELKRIMEILKESKGPVSAKTLWQSSIHKDDIDEFYSQIKIHIESGEIKETRKGKESLLELIDKK
jgi:type I restriction enzyme S subunit